MVAAKRLRTFVRKIQTTHDPNKHMTDPFNYVAIARDGLGWTSQPQKIIIIGAGMAGLCAGYELMRAGHDVHILEANDDADSRASGRVGGRVWTMRQEFSDGLYGEAGAMRIPTSQALTNYYLQTEFGLQVRPFPNPDTGFVYQNGSLTYLLCKNPNDLSWPPNAINQKLGFMLGWFQKHVAGWSKNQQVYWDHLVDQYENMSLLELFQTFQGYDSSGKKVAFTDKEIQYIGDLGVGLGGYAVFFENAAVEFLRFFLAGWESGDQEVIGGMDQFPYRFFQTAPRPTTGTPPGYTYGTLQAVTTFGARVSKLDYSDRGVTITYTDRAGHNPQQISGDYAIVTCTLPALAQIEENPPFSPGKRRAIRELEYTQSAKVFLQTRSRFWEETVPAACPDVQPNGQPKAGTVASDSILATSYFPVPHTPPDPIGPGVILATYTWGALSTQFWYPLSARRRAELSARLLGKIFPDVQQPGMVDYDHSPSVAWGQDDRYGGAFALFRPGQIRAMYQDIIQPEGRVYFAGEHCAFAHGWIEGALESALRVSIQISHQAQGGDI